ncbi:hypothetical protein ACQ7NX_20475 [Enterobacter cloacae subsp. dissolvens]
MSIIHYGLITCTHLLSMKNSMHFCKILSSIFLFALSFSSHAFLLNLNKCGDNVAISALKNGLIREAFSIPNDLESTEADIDEYGNRLASLEMLVSHVKTLGKQANDVRCQATISFRIPKEVIAFFEVRPALLNELIALGGVYNTETVTWPTYTYELSVAGASLEFISRVDAQQQENIALAMYALSRAAITSDYHLRKQSRLELLAASNAYSMFETRLNMLLQRLPEAEQQARENEHNAWIKEMITRCGSPSGPESTWEFIVAKTRIYECYSLMTMERYDALNALLSSSS